MIDMAVADEAEAFVAGALAEGLRLGAGRKKVEELEPGSFFRPMHPSCKIIRGKAAHEAVEVSNNCRCGFAGGVWT